MTRRAQPLRAAAGRLVDGMRENLAGATLSLFEHAPYPLAGTLDHRGDPGVLGPDSISWRVIADPAAFVGGLRALLIQAAHPEVVAGVDQYSRYQDDPLGRLSRTSAYVTATTFGAMPEVDEAVGRVRQAHSRVAGTSSRGIDYRASDPGYSAWVHNALTDSFLTTNQRYSDFPLTVVEADRFVEEQRRIGALLGADPMPATASSLSSWIVGHPDIDESPEMRKVVEFLANPPVPPAIKVGYLLILEAAAASLPTRIQGILGVRPKPAGEVLGRAAVKSLRWAMGYSPSWALALTRVDAEIPKGLFRRPPDVLGRAS